MSNRKKLIEVSLPLDLINKASAEEKGNPFLKGHPRNLHQWWARRPLPACRAVLFASLIDDPSCDPIQFPTEESQEKERSRLFDLMEELIQWDNSTNIELLERVQVEIKKHVGDVLPSVLDPFAGGGAIPVEARRLGLKVHASDLNPVAVLLNKALVEIPPKFCGRKPVNPESALKFLQENPDSAAGLALDVKYYAKQVLAKVEPQLRKGYPKAKLEDGTFAPVITWLWARVIRCPNPGCSAPMPLVRSFALSTKGEKKSYLHPIIENNPLSIRWTISDTPGALEGTIKKGKGAICLFCSTPQNPTPVGFDYIRAEGKAGRVSYQLMAKVAQLKKGRAFLAPTAEEEKVALAVVPIWQPETDLPAQALGFRVQQYGIYKHSDLFTQRQLASLALVSGSILEHHAQIISDAIAAGFEKGLPLSEGGVGAHAYADAVVTYLAFALDKAADYGNTICTWNPSNANVSHLFTKHTIQMAWDFAESSILDGGLAFDKLSTGVVEGFSSIRGDLVSSVKQVDAAALPKFVEPVIICTDPPYYDNISYADLADFFYIWLRHTLSKIYPSLFQTLLTPKSEEVIATPFRFNGDKEKAQKFFEERLGEAFKKMHDIAHPDFPMTVFYAFKQSESDDEAQDSAGNAAKSSTGWETMLEALIKAGLMIVGTWPMRTERAARARGQGSNALASSVVLVARPREISATQVTRKDFMNELNKELPLALKRLQEGNIAPVDLEQAVIGPGMAIYSRHSRVLEVDGMMSVRTALQLINQVWGQFQAEQEGEFDRDTRWALSWFEQYGFDEAEYGFAETLSTAKNTSVKGLEEAGIVVARAGKVRLLKRADLAKDWTPQTDNRLTTWECVQYLIIELERGEEGAARLLNQMSELAESCRDLAYRLYTICENKGLNQEAFAYNNLVNAWSELNILRAKLPQEQESQDVQQQPIAFK